MYVFVWICVYLWGYVYIHECVNEYICMNACTHIWVYMWMYVCKCKSMNTYVYMWKHAWAHLYVHEWICIYACMHGCAYVYEFTYVCGIVCVYMEEELSYRVLGEKNLEKWREGWCWYSAKGWDSGVLWTESLSPLLYEGRWEESRHVLGCCAAWASGVLDFVGTTFWSLQCPEAHWTGAWGDVVWDWVCLSVCCHSRSEGLKSDSSSVLPEWATWAAGIYDLMI